MPSIARCALVILFVMTVFGSGAVAQQAAPRVQTPSNPILPLCAMTGTLEDLSNDLLLVFRDPGGDNYSTSMTLQARESVSPIVFPECRFSVGDLLPQAAE